MVASIGAVAAPAQGASYYERDGYYANDDPDHRSASAWAGRGAGDLGLKGPVDPDSFRSVLEGVVPDGSGQRLGRRGKDGTIEHRPGRDLTLSAPKSVSVMALVGGDERIRDAHDRAVARTLGWVERNAIETRMRDPETGRMVRAGNQKMVAATFRHDTSRNLDPQLHTHSVIANMVRGPDGKWRTMANEALYEAKMTIGALYRGELARELGALGYRIEKTHADGRFEIAGVPQTVIEAFSTRRADIKAAMEERGLGNSAENPALAARAALMTRATKREVDRDELRETWGNQAEVLGFDAKTLVPEGKSLGANGQDMSGGIPVPGANTEATGASPEAKESPTSPREQEQAREAVAWAVDHLSEREAVFGRGRLIAAAVSWRPGVATIAAIETEIDRLRTGGTLHTATIPGKSGWLTTDRAVADEKETIDLMKAGQGRSAAPMRGRAVDKALRKGPLGEGQRDAVKLILSSRDRVVGVQGYAGTGKTTMLNRARALLEKRGYRTIGLAPSATAAQNLEAESGIPSETLQRFLARNAGIAEGRLTKKGEKEMRATFAKTALVIDEGSFTSTVQARDLLRIAGTLRIPRVVLVGDAKQLDAVDAGKPFAQLQNAGMATAVMTDIRRQRDPELKAAVEASLAGDVKRAFEKLGSRVAEVKDGDLAGEAAARWLALTPEARERTALLTPGNALRGEINTLVRERLIREGAITGPGLDAERLASRGYTNAEKALAGNYQPGDVVAFHRRYKRLGVERGDEMRVAKVDQESGQVFLEGRNDRTAVWEPARLAARTGGVEVYRVEGIELRAGDRIRWTRNDAGLGVVNSQLAEVAKIEDGRVFFRLEDGRVLALDKGDPQMRHLDRAWASTVHAFQGRTVDGVIAAMEAGHPHLTTQKTLYVEISRARDSAELITDDAGRLKEQLEMATGERIAALEAFAENRMNPSNAPNRLASSQDNSLQSDQHSRQQAGIEKSARPRSPDLDVSL